MNFLIFQRLPKVYNYVALLCCLLCLSTACGKKAPPIPLSEVREMEQEKQKATTPKVPVEGKNGESNNTKGL